MKVNMLARNCFEVFRITGIAVFTTALVMAQGVCVPESAD